MKTKNFTLAFIFNILIYGASLAETIEEKMAKYVLLNMQQDYITCYAFYKIGAEYIKQSNGEQKIIEGVEIVKNDLVSIFKKNGIELIECINKKFDPNFHQAMLEIEDEAKEAGTVIQEIQKGYMMKDRLLRPSLVGVTKKRAKKSENSSNNDEKNKGKSK